jgi:protein-disulfide isomerase
MRLSVLALLLLLPCLAATPGNIHGNAFGSPAAPIVMEIFSDFQCPACKRLHDEALPTLLRDYVYPGKVYLVCRYFPLPNHAYGRQSAELACACAQFGKYEQAANLLFAKQATWSNDGKLREAVEGILSPAERTKLPGLMKDPAVQNQINRDMEQGRALPVQSTPTLVLTSGLRRYPISGPSVLNYNLLKVLLDDLLSKR